MSDGDARHDGALAGLTVIDCSTLFAGPMAAMLLADYGAEVIKIEHPAGGDPARSHGHARDGVGLWFKTLGRGKRSVAADLRTADGAELLRRLCEGADVLIENFRPGTLERWGLGPERLRARNPGLVVARVTGFGQRGPLAHRPGFGTLAEAMSGFAHITGEADGPPTLPPFGLADGIAGIMAAFAVMVALRHRERTGEGQVIDISLIEPILLVLGAQATVFDQLGIVQRRSGNRSANNAPRNTYRTRDGRWVAVSTSATPVAERVMRLVGRDDLVAQPWFATGRGRAQHADELDEAVGRWIGEHDLEEVVRRFDEAQAAVAPVYDIQQALADPQYRALETFIRVPDPELGSVLMQNVPFRMQATPGRVRWAGEPLGASTDAVLESVGIAPRAQRRCR